VATSPAMRLVYVYKSYGGPGSRRIVPIEPGSATNVVDYVQLVGVDDEGQRWAFVVRMFPPGLKRSPESLGWIHLPTVVLSNDTWPGVY
jgi:hypothetical protein